MATSKYIFNLMKVRWAQDKVSLTFMCRWVFVFSSAAGELTFVILE